MLTTAGGDIETTRQVIAAFKEAAGDDKPMYLQYALSWAATGEEAFEKGSLSLLVAGGEVQLGPATTRRLRWNRPLVSPTQMGEYMKISADLGRHRSRIDELIELGADRIYLTASHGIRRNSSAPWDNTYCRYLLADSPNSTDYWL